MKRLGFTPLEKTGASKRRLSLTGFTLMEVIVAITILSLLSAGFFSVAFSARNLTWRSRMRLRGVEIARHRIEELRRFVRADTWDTGSLRVMGWTAWTAAPEDSQFQTRYIVQAIGGGYQCRNVTVQVRWNESGM
ncbi:MAG: prepilin-type N-terminal cleavage/methylation domain-containing protein [Candidatus Velamenicoccus archaeovorus]